MNNKFKILKVTVERLYLIPMIDEKRTKINGWTMEQVKEDWFVTHNINKTHATRNAHMIGYSEKVLHIEELNTMPGDDNETHRRD